MTQNPQARGGRAILPRRKPRLPEPIVEPRTPATTLVAEAHARGQADAGTHVRDAWSFGDPRVPNREEKHEPDYVLELRKLCEAAVSSARDRHLSVLSQTEPLRKRRDEAARRMAAARKMMDFLANRDSFLREPTEEDDQPAAVAPPPHDDAAPQVPDAVTRAAPDAVTRTAPDDAPEWEGETTALAARWRALILAGLTAVLSLIHYLVFEYFLAGHAGTPLIGGIACAAAVLVVLGPYVTAILLRSGKATGSDRALTPAAVIMGLAWSAAAALVGVMAGSVVAVDESRVASLDVTSLSVILFFGSVILVGGTLSFMLGLAKRHPFQEAYAEARQRFEDLDTRLQEMIAELDPGFANPAEVVPGQEPGMVQPETLEEAVRAAYAAAEHAYYDGLVAAFGDPTFTEAVEQRQGLRPGGVR